MTSRMMRISLVTAATIAALAATSCGSQSLNEGFEGDVDLISSTSQPADSELIAAELRGLSEIVFEPFKPLIPLNQGEMILGHDTYINEDGAYEVEAQVGVGFDGDSFEPIYEEVLRINSAENELAYAQWGFEDADDDNLIRYIKVHGNGDFAEDGGYYVAVSDYEKGHYQILGPYQQFDEWIKLLDIVTYSSKGHTYISLICFDGDTMNVRGLTMTVGHPNAAQAT